MLFSSQEVIKDKRTSLNLTPEKKLHFSNGFVLEFESNFRQKGGVYGNIFKIVGNKSLNIDLISNFIGGPNAKPDFLLVVNNAIVVNFEWKEIPKGGFEKWINFKLEYDNTTSSIALTINGERKSAKVKAIADIKDFEIVFGKSSIPNFVTTDVSPMSVKHVKISSDNILIQNWNLGKHLKNNKVLDEIHSDIAETKNPIWLLDEHLNWSKNSDLKFNQLQGFCQDEKKGLVFFIDKKAVYIYNLKNQVMDTLNYTNNPYPCQGNTFIYNAITNEIWSYSFDKSLISKFSFNTSSWSSKESSCIEPNFWHHNKLLSPIDNSLITFGGYGHYKYKNTFQTFNPKTSSWKSVENNKIINPRYLSAAGILNKDTFLIFGGYGSESGEQAVNSHCFYDLYSVSFNGLKVRQLWGKSIPDQSPFVPVGSMVIDSKSNHFYSLIYDNNNYNTNLKLARFGIKEFEMTLFPDNIPYKFLDIKSNGNFFLDTTNSNLIALISNENNVKLYSLSYPPLLEKDVYQEEPFPLMYTILLFLSGIGIIAAAVLLYKRKRNKKYSPKSSNETIFTSAEEFQNELHLYDKKKTSAIYLFGGFEVFDKEGKDITALFTPTLKQLFLLILLSKSKNDKGISSNKVIENIWYDKSENSARNNKNVNISKLKLLLDKIGNVELNHENTYLNIQFGENTFCDYNYVINLLSRVKTKDYGDERIAKFLNIISASKSYTFA